MSETEADNIGNKALARKLARRFDILSYEQALNLVVKVKKLDEHFKALQEKLAVNPG